MIWAAFAAMVVIVLAILLAPLLRPRASGPGRAVFDLALAKDQLAEIDRDVERGVLDTAQAEIMRAETQRRLLVASERRDAAAPLHPRFAIAAILIVVPLVSFGVYRFLGAPDLPDQPYSARADQIHRMQAQMDQIRGMVDRLAARLKANPADGKGWAMLGKSLGVLGQLGEAKDAYEHAMKLLPGDVQVRLEYASLLIGDVPENAPLPDALVAVMHDVLAIDPHNPDALYFAGLAEAQAGHVEEARAMWTKLLVQLPSDSPQHAEIAQQLQALKP